MNSDDKNGKNEERFFRNSDAVNFYFIERGYKQNGYK